jgi:hypothetical protein
LSFPHHKANHGANPISDPPYYKENKSTPKNYLWNQEADVLWDPDLERSHQEKIISEICKVNTAWLKDIHVQYVPIMLFLYIQLIPVPGWLSRNFNRAREDK